MTISWTYQSIFRKTISSMSRRHVNIQQNSHLKRASRSANVTIKMYVE